MSVTEQAITISDGDHEVMLTWHAITRYRERVRPTLTIVQALGELTRVAKQYGRVEVKNPVWCGTRHTPAIFLIIGDDIALPLKAGDNYRLEAVTCLSRDALSLEQVKSRRIRRSRRRGAALASTGKTCVAYRRPTPGELDLAAIAALEPQGEEGTVVVRAGTDDLLSATLEKQSEGLRRNG